LEGAVETADLPKMEKNLVWGMTNTEKEIRSRLKKGGSRIDKSRRGKKGFRIVKETGMGIEGDQQRDDSETGRFYGTGANFKRDEARNGNGASLRWGSRSILTRGWLRFNFQSSREKGGMSQGDTKKERGLSAKKRTAVQGAGKNHELSLRKGKLKGRGEKKKGRETQSAKPQPEGGKREKKCGQARNSKRLGSVVIWTPLPRDKKKKWSREGEKKGTRGDN